MGPFFDYRVEEYLHVNALWNIGIRPSANFIEQKRVSEETRVCYLITRLMNNQIKGRRKATFQKEEKVKTNALWQL